MENIETERTLESYRRWWGYSKGIDTVRNFKGVEAFHNLIGTKTVSNSKFIDEAIKSGKDI